MNLKELSDEKLVLLYPSLINELKARDIIRTNNIVGEIGETIAVNYYNKYRKTKLTKTEKSFKNIDAISDSGERYSIKTISTNTTGAIRGVGKLEDKLFDKLVIVQFNEDYTLNRIIEMDWGTFFKHKKWHSRVQAYDIRITNDLLADSKVFDLNDYFE